ncbi:MAG TPA: MBOAT family O-acyltransferase [Flavisolibacter sp.]|nr:MBOAT family O-acyltransferase [Flavisolibacter sp.]
MLFNSLEFFVFFLIVIPLYFLLPHRFRWVMLIIASSIFYMYFKPVYILILVFTIIIDYFAGMAIENSRSQRTKKMLLVVSLVSNIGVLCFFKYFNFLSINLSGLLSLSGREVHLPLLHMLLPIGLSFHTFQAMSYNIEIYRGNQKAEKHLGYFALYVLYFPQLVAGPIERPQNVLHQLRAEHRFDHDRFIQGLQLMLWGLFKKMVIADRLGVFVDTVYANPESFHGFQIIIAILFFAFQLYCDFSGYSDVALGVSRIMGIDLMLNFRRPFLSKTVTEYWRRWHISLSTWFNDYLFTPFVFARRNWGIWATVAGLALTFFISGIWHGAGWTFIIYGCLHGVALIYEVLTKKTRRKWSKKIPGFIYNPLSILLTFTFAALSWVFFRAFSMHDVFTIYKNMFVLKSFSFGVPTVTSYNLYLMFILIFFLLLSENIYEYFKGVALRVVHVRYLSIYVLAFLIFIIGIFEKQTFIYFQF